jgi:hypothetical protein
LLGRDDRPSRSLHAGDGFRIEVEAAFFAPEPTPVIGVCLDTASGVPVYYDYAGHEDPHPVEAGDVLAGRVELPAALPTGSYTVRMTIRSGFGGPAYAISDPLSFYVDGRDSVKGVADLQGRFVLAREGGATDVNADEHSAGAARPAISGDASAAGSGPR